MRKRQSVAQELEGDYLYHFMTIRADRGKLENLLDWIAETKASGFFEEAGPVTALRHASQPGRPMGPDGRRAHGKLDRVSRRRQDRAASGGAAEIC